MQIQIKSKRTIAIIAVITAALIVLAGAFAWNSLNQQRINVFRELVVPGVNLHDDFDAPNKDVYVENSGEIPVIVRVRLTEFLQTSVRGSLVAGHERTGENETDNARINWAPHSGIGGVTECCADEYFTLGENWPSGDWFHEYYEWKMGGQKYYMPATELLGVDENGEYIAWGENPPVCDDTTEYTEEDYLDPENPVRQTLSADIISMADWLSGGRQQGEFWIVDTDDWCYWAQLLDPDTATGLLLDSVTRTGKAFDSDAEYCINVWLQAVDEMDIDLLRISENGGISENGIVLTQIIADKILVAQTGALYENNRDGTFTQLTDPAGNTIAEPAQFIPIGAEAETASVTEKINTSEDKRLYVGDTFDFTPLVWNGESYVNYDELAEMAPPYYNIVKKSGDSGAYTVEGTEIGEDGKVYLKITDGEGKALYLASVLVNTVQGFRSGGVTYVQGYPGTGPFGLIYRAPEKEKVGSEEDTRYDPEEFYERFFLHLDSGVYIETANRNSHESKDEPVKYYFAGGTLESSVFLVNKSDGRSVALDEAFGAVLEEGCEFNYTEGKIAPVADDEHGEYTFTGFTEGGIALDCGCVLAPIEGFYGKDGAAKLLTSAEESGEIGCRHSMDWLSAQVGGGNDFAGATFTVVKDFDMGTASFTPIGRFDWNNPEIFNGTFDGGGFTISNLKVSCGESGGLFGYVGSGGKVKNVKLDNILVDSLDNVGGIAGISDGVIENCQILGGDINGSNFIGGIAGSNSGTIETCYNGADVTAAGSTIGGIAGASDGTIKHCANTGNVIVSPMSSGGGVGGVVGANGGDVIGCYAWGDVSGYDYVGGVVGEFNGFMKEITSAYHAFGSVEGSTSTVGGVVGYWVDTSYLDFCVALATGLSDGAESLIGGGWDVSGDYCCYAGERIYTGTAGYGGDKYSGQEATMPLAANFWSTLHCENWATNDFENDSVWEYIYTSEYGYIPVIKGFPIPDYVTLAS